MEDLTGRQFGHYQIVSPLGEGGMAAVYKAHQISMDRYVAIKVLPRQMAESEEFQARFKREAKLLAHLEHPHILPVFDFGEADGYPYIVMTYIEGGTLADLMMKRHFSLPEIVKYISQVGDALAYAHGRGMIHRDIKPSNVLVDARGNCLLTDFGLARMTVTDSKLTSSGSVMGTPAYMSPEQGMGKDIDQRSDIYSLGVILYEMLTYRVPYVAETPVAVVFKHVQDPLPPAHLFNEEIPQAVEEVLNRALAKNPDERFQNAEEFVRALQHAVPDAFATAVLPPTKYPSQPGVSKPVTPNNLNRPPTGNVKNKNSGNTVLKVVLVLFILLCLLFSAFACFLVYYKNIGGFFSTQTPSPSPTSTVLPSETPLPTSTLTPTFTLTPAKTFTASPTRTPTFTPTDTPTPTRTPVPTKPKNDGGGGSGGGGGPIEGGG